VGPRTGPPVSGVSSPAPGCWPLAAADLVHTQTLHGPAQQFFRGREKPHRVRQPAVDFERRLVNPLGVNGELARFADGFKRTHLDAAGLRPRGFRDREKRGTKVRAPLWGRVKANEKMK